MLMGGDLDRAFGCLVRAWALGQVWYLKTPHRAIPPEEWEKSLISDKIVQAGLAEFTDNGVRIKGADEQFFWLLQKSKAGKANRGPFREIIEEKIEQVTSGDVVRRALPLIQAQAPPFANTKTKDKGISLSGESSSPLVEIWNSHRNNLPECKVITTKRKKGALARWGERPDESYWVGVIAKLAGSNFCNGQNDRGWRADIDFLLRPDTHVKAFEGKYDNRTGPKSKSQQISDHNAEMFAAVERGEL